MPARPAAPDERRATHVNRVLAAPQMFAKTAFQFLPMWLHHRLELHRQEAVEALL